MVKKIAKWIFGILVTILLLLILLIFLFQLPSAQNWLKEKATQYLSQKIGSKVIIGKFKTNYINDLSIQDIKLEDKSQKLLLKIGKLQLNYKLIELLNNKIVIDALNVDTLQVFINRSNRDSSYNFDFISQAFSDKPNQKPLDTKFNYQISFGKISLNEFSLMMDDQWDRQYYTIQGNKLSSVIQSINLKKNEYKIQSLIVNELLAEAYQGNNLKPVPTQTTNSVFPTVMLDTFMVSLKQLKVELGSEKMKLQAKQSHFLARDLTFFGPSKIFSLSHLQISQDSLHYQTGIAKPSIKKIINFSNIDLYHLEFIADSINNKNNMYSGKIISLKASEKSGFEITHLMTGIQFSENEIMISNFDLATPNSKIQADLLLGYSSLSTLQNKIDLATINAKVKQAKISKVDLAYLGLNQLSNVYAQKILSNDIEFSGTAIGKVNDFVVNDLILKNSGFLMQLSGRFRGLPNPNMLSTSLQLKNISGSADRLKQLLPANLIPANIAIPDQFTLRGKFNGGMKDPNFDLIFASSDGDIVLKGWVKELKSQQKYSYNIQARSPGFYFNKFLKDSMYGKTVFDVSAVGEGISIPIVNATITCSLPEVFLNGYLYHDLNLQTSLHQSLLDVDIQFNDAALQANGNIKYSLDSLHPLLITDVVLSKLDVHALGYYADSLVIGTSIQANMTLVNQNHLNGDIYLPILSVAAHGENIKLDSCKLNGSFNDGKQKIELILPFSKFVLDGKYELGSLPEISKQMILSYISSNTIEKKKTELPECVAELDFLLNDHPLLHNLFPDLGDFKGLGISGKMDARKRGLFLLGIMPFVQYGTGHVDSTFFTAGIYNDSLHLDLISSNISYSALNIHHAYVSAHAKEGAFNWGLKLLNADDLISYDLKGTLQYDAESYLLHLKDSLLLNNEYWSVNANNSIRYVNIDKTNMNLELFSGAKKIQIKSPNWKNCFPMKLELDDFPISTFTKINQSDTAMIDGIINGSVSLEHFQPFRFTGHVELDNLTTYGHGIGSISIVAANDVNETIQTKVQLNGYGNAAILDAAIMDEGKLKGELQIDSLSFSSIGPLMKKYFSELGGTANGHFNIGGRLSKPTIVGSLLVKSAHAIYNDYNTYARIDTGLVEFNERGILLNNLIVKDSIGNQANINGAVLTDNYFEYRYDMQITTDHFLVVNKKRTKEQHLYGPIRINSDIRLISKRDILFVNGDVVVNDNSNVNFEMEDESANLDNWDGIIEYYNSQKTVKVVSKAKDIHATLYNEKPLKMQFNFNLEITKNSTLNIILDQEGGDYLKANGDANLTITENESGKMSVFGNYTVENGEYILSLNEFIKRKFQIQKGGSIKWDGNPMNGVIDLTALYQVTTSVESLLSS